jgi:hypothetical protein
LAKVQDKLTLEIILSLNKTYTEVEAGNIRQIIIFALETVIDVRIVLGWSYTYAFFIKEDGPRNLFEHSQKLVEEIAEKLTLKSEQSLARLIVPAELNELQHLANAVLNQVQEFEMYDNNNNNMVENTQTKKKG